VITKRIIAAFLFVDGVLYRTRKFIPDYRYTSNFLVVDQADEIFMIDITPEGPSEASHEAMSELADRCFAPVTMGGHVNSVEDVSKFMGMGADKVVIGRVFFDLYDGAERIDQIAKKYGSQAIVAGIDCRENMVWAMQGRIQTWYSAVKMAEFAKTCGAGEIFLQSIDRDGSLDGFDLDLLREVLGSVSIPVVIGGGCRGWRDMQAAFDAGADGAVTNNIHHITEGAMKGFRDALLGAGVHVRPVG